MSEITAPPAPAVAPTPAHAPAPIETKTPKAENFKTYAGVILLALIAFYFWSTRKKAVAIKVLQKPTENPVVAIAKNGVGI